MAQLTESVANIIDQFAKLPGIGRKSAERLAYHVLQAFRRCQYQQRHYQQF